MEDLRLKLITELRKNFTDNSKEIGRIVTELNDSEFLTAGKIIDGAEMISHFRNLNEVYNNVLNKLTIKSKKENDEKEN